MSETKTTMCPRCNAPLRPEAWDRSGRMLAACGSRIYVEGKSREPSEFTPQCTIATQLAESERLRGVIELCDIAMETAAINGVQKLLAPAYQESWATAHQAAIAALTPKEQTDDAE